MVSPGRFLFLALVLATLAVAAILFHAAPWRVGVLLVAACALALTSALVHHMSIFNTPEAERVGEKIRRFQPERPDFAERYYWAGENLTFDAACKHFVVIGATGAGKSIVLNLLMQSVFAKFGRKPAVKNRALVYDSKCDLASTISGLAPQARIVFFNPLDDRFTPWNIAADVVTETDAYEFASILLPKNEKESSPYFSDTARSLIVGVIKRFNAATRPRNSYWTFRDLILAFKTTDRLRQILSDNEVTEYLREHFQSDNSKNFAGVKSTVDNTLAQYRPIAALLASAKNPPFSLSEWLQSESVLLIGNHENAREATDTYNRLIFRQLSKMLMAREGRIENDRTWIFLDELREAGVLPGLRQLLLRGRSKGVAVAMGFQDLEGIYAAYGEHDGAEIVGAAQNAMILHINPTAPKTAQWASQMFGSRRGEVQTNSQNQQDSGMSYGNSSQLGLIENVLPIQFTQLPMPANGDGLEFYSFTNTRRFGESAYDWTWLKEHGPLGKSGRQVDFESVKDHQRAELKDWDAADRLRLCLAAEEEKPKAKNPLARESSIANIRLVTSR